jgi:hypothetical protein
MVTFIEFSEYPASGIMTHNKEWWANIGKRSTSTSKNYHGTSSDDDITSRNASEPPSTDKASKASGSKGKRLLIIGLLSLVPILSILLYYDTLFEAATLSFENNKDLKNNSELFSILGDFLANGGNFNALTSTKQQTIHADQNSTPTADPSLEENNNPDSDDFAGSTPEVNDYSNVLPEPSLQTDAKPTPPDALGGQQAMNNEQPLAEDQTEAPVSDFTDDNFGILMADPSMYIGYDVVVTGQISSISFRETPSYDTDVSGEISQIRSIEMLRSSDTSDHDLQNRWIVLLSDGSVLNMNSDSGKLRVEDCLKIKGTVQGSSYHRTSLGEVFRVPVIGADSLEGISCIDSVMPALHTIELNLSKTIGDVTLTAKRVQFSEDHTRIELEARNTGIGDKTFLRSKESVALQDGVAYSDISHLPKFAEYRIGSVLLPSTSTTGYLFFEPVAAHGNTPTELVSFNIVVEEVKITEDQKSNFVFNINYLARVA